MAGELRGTQLIRLVDVLLLGPAMIWAGDKVSRKHNVIGAFLSVSGVSAIVFNGINFLRRAQSGDTELERAE